MTDARDRYLDNAARGVVDALIKEMASPREATLVALRSLRMLMEQLPQQDAKEIWALLQEVIAARGRGA